MIFLRDFFTGIMIIGLVWWEHGKDRLRVFLSCFWLIWRFYKSNLIQQITRKFSYITSVKYLQFGCFTYYWNSLLLSVCLCWIRRMYFKHFKSCNNIIVPFALQCHLLIQIEMTVGVRLCDFFRREKEHFSGISYVPCLTGLYWVTVPELVIPHCN